MNEERIREIEDEDVLCPYCAKKVLDVAIEDDSALAECPHLVAVLPWENAGELEFEPQSPVASWWEDYIERIEAEDDFAEASELAQCPALDAVIVHTSNGFACGPVAFTVTFGFRQVPPPEASADRPASPFARLR
jgi:hypothetical protein